jgi:8-amino-7-oxononanoate synthase
MIMHSLDNFVNSKLELLKKENRLRELSISNASIDFSSNDYLGLARSEELFNLISEKSKILHPKKNGATGSRLLSGNCANTQKVEIKLAEIFKGEAALIFNSGYTANQAVLSSIPQRGDTIIYDELAHACIKDGARLSSASRYSFKHNDLNDLENKIKKSKGKVFIAVESVYSMDGDQSSLSEITTLAKKYDTAVLLDEAHSTGVLGKQGGGLAVSLQLEQEIDFRIYTFGKAMGVHGACVVGQKNSIKYLVNFARPFIYTTALPPHSITSIHCAFEFLAKNMDLQKKLNDNINLFRFLAKGLSISKGSTSSIQTLVIPGNTKVKSAAQKLQQAGFDVRAILSPTVKEGSERLRICLHAFNTEKHIKQLVEELKKLESTF